MNVPKHIGIILDGNRRFAKKHGWKPWVGHDKGRDVVESLYGWGKELGIKEFTLYAFSMQNFQRSEDEKNHLFNLMRKAFEDLKKDIEKYKAEGLRINFIGRLYLFSEDIQEIMKYLMKETKDCDKLKVNFAMAYGGREEIVDATKKIAQKVKDGGLSVDDINQEIVDKNVYLSSKPDLIIRTGGAMRTSNFLSWQSSYAELFFVDEFWPEFTKEILVKVIEEFNSRQRRFGK